MSEHDDSTLDARIDEAFGPVIDDIAAGAVERERDRRLPVAEVAALRDAGLGALRVPTAFGGWGRPWSSSSASSSASAKPTRTCRSCCAGTWRSSRRSAPARRATSGRSG
nr:hypothetical protein GCM10025699_40160 [Microbacterium flavescens]BFF16359.1 hypothetical protein GCM10025699_76620 [Microbacterium flavescens]